MGRDAATIELSRGGGRAALRLTALPMGADWAVAIRGGDGPHLGAVALAGPDGAARCLSLGGHREGPMAMAAAAALSSRLGAAVSVSCGVHIEGATREEIALAEEAAALLAQDLAGEIAAGRGARG
jgi:hypothetical protein